MTEKKKRKYTHAFHDGWDLGVEAAKDNVGPVRKIPRSNEYDQERLHWEHGYIRGYITALEFMDKKILKEIKDDE